MELIDILKSAKNELVVRGRTTGTLINGSTGKVCPLGAVGLVVDPGFAGCGEYYTFAPNGPGYAPVQELLKYLPDDAGIEEHGFREYDDLYLFNDSYVGPGKEGDKQVLAVFDRAIAGLEVAA